MRKTLFRFLALNLALLLMFTMIPFSASATEFVSENLFRTQLASSTSVLFATQATTADTTSTRFNAALAGSVDGVTNVNCDAYALSATDSRLIGGQYSLTSAFYVEELIIYAGISTIADNYRVFASDTLSTLYSNTNLIVNSVACKGSAVTVPIKKTVQYVAIIFDSITANQTNARVAEFQLMSGDPTTAAAKVNVLQTKLQTAKAIYKNINTGAVTANTAVTAAKLATLTDNNLDVPNDIGTVSTANVGLEYTLNENVYCDIATISAGLSGYPDYSEKYSVYASVSPDNLYDSSNLIASDVYCNGFTNQVQINKTIKYISFVCTAYNGNMRVKEFQVFEGVAPEGTFVPENLLQTKLSASQSVNMYVSNGNTESSTRFSETALANSVDGNTVTTTDVYGALDWDPARYIGAVYSISSLNYCDKAVIYSGSDANKDTYKVYASASLDDLYSANNLVAENVVCGDQPQTVAINKEVQYIAFFCTNYVGNQRVREFQLWSAKKPETPVDPNPSELKVLTIGNSFAQNASIYASEIAAASGKSLTFGYLKVSSCTIAKHLDYATRDVAPYQFTIVSPTNQRTTLTNEDVTNETAGTKMSAALVYDDWDYIVFQESSVGAISTDAFTGLTGLVNYVKNLCPSAKLAMHETWSWSSWEDPASDAYYNGTRTFRGTIEPNYLAAAESVGINTIIPVGVAFDYARDYLNNYHLLNDADKQHANDSGCYLAGAAYFATLFGANIMTNTVGNGHPYITQNGAVDMNILRTSVAKAMHEYYPETFADVAIPVAPDQPTESVNLFRTEGYLSSARAINQFVSNGTVEAAGSGGFTNTVSILNDGSLGVVKDSYTYYDLPDYPKYTGVEYTLAASYAVDKLVLYSGFTTSKDTYKVYASNSLANLYSAESLIQENVVCQYGYSNTATEVNIGKSVKYIAILCTGFELYCARPAEFELFSKVDTAIVGDLNADNIVNIIDLVRIKKMVANLQYSDVADLNHDKEVNVNDLIILRKILLGIAS